jgi:AlkA N-terminal domain
MGNTSTPRGLVTVTPEPGTAAAQAGMLPAGQPRSSFRRGLGVFGENKQADGGLALRVPFQPPLAWDAMLGVLRARAIPGVEHVSDVGYRRTVVIDDDPGVIELTPEGPENLVLRAPAALGGPDPRGAAGAPDLQPRRRGRASRP